MRLEGSILHINYDINEADPSDRFTVGLIVTDKDGNEIQAQTLSGDVGEDIKPGNELHIRWNLEADDIELDGDLFVSISVDIQSPYRTKASGESFSRTGVILQSLALPGLGMSRLTGDPHWIRGVAAYGSLAGSLVFNKMAVDTYGEYKLATDSEEASSLLSAAQQQDQISEGLAYTAAAIWVIDLVWNIVGTSGMKELEMRTARNLDIGTSFDRLSGAPLLTLSYKF